MPKRAAKAMTETQEFSENRKPDCFSLLRSSQLRLAMTLLVRGFFPQQVEASIEKSQLMNGGVKWRRNMKPS